MHLRRLLLYLLLLAILLGAGARSSKWEAVRSHHLEIEPTCAACGTNKNLVAHHILPVHLWPELELDDSNLITLCESDHLTFGHGGDWRAFVPSVREDAKRHLATVKARCYKRSDLKKYLSQFPQRSSL